MIYTAELPQWAETTCTIIGIIIALAIIVLFTVGFAFYGFKEYKNEKRRKNLWEQKTKEELKYYKTLNKNYAEMTETEE